jgi:hypothetical protein
MSDFIGRCNLQTVISDFIGRCNLQTVMSDFIGRCNLQTAMSDFIGRCNLQTVMSDFIGRCNLQTVMSDFIGRCNLHSWQMYSDDFVIFQNIILKTILCPIIKKNYQTKAELNIVSHYYYNIWWVSLVKQELLTLPEHLSSPPILSEVRVTQSLVLYVSSVDRCLSFCTFSFGHCVVCSSSIYGF